MNFYNLNMLYSNPQDLRVRMMQALDTRYMRHPVA